MSPFRSKAQMKWMFVNKPKMAQEWAEKTKDAKDLPEKVDKAEFVDFSDITKAIVRDDIRRKYGLQPTITSKEVRAKMKLVSSVKGITRGWISPAGQRHELPEGEFHGPWIKNKTGMSEDAAHRSGWFSYGRGGSGDTIGGSRDQFTNTESPAMKELSNVIKQSKAKRIKAQIDNDMVEVDSESLVHGIVPSSEDNDAFKSMRHPKGKHMTMQSGKHAAAAKKSDVDFSDMEKAEFGFAPKKSSYNLDKPTISPSAIKNSSPNNEIKDQVKRNMYIKMIQGINKPQTAMKSEGAVEKRMRPEEDIESDLWAARKKVSSIDDPEEVKKIHAHIRSLQAELKPYNEQRRAKIADRKLNPQYYDGAGNWRDPMAKKSEEAPTEDSWHAGMTAAYSEGLLHGKNGSENISDKHEFKAAYNQGYEHGRAARPKQNNDWAFSTMKSESKFKPLDEMAANPRVDEMARFDGLTKSEIENKQKLDKMNKAEIKEIEGWVKKADEAKLNGYIAFHNKKGKLEIRAKSSYAAQQEAVKQWGIKPNKSHEVSVVLAEKDGEPVVHTPLM